MASGIDVRVGALKETTYGTRAVPARFFEFTDVGMGYDVNHYESQGLGGGPWRKKRVQTTQRGAGALPMEVPTVGFGFWLDLLHGATPTVVQQAATIAYLQTHMLSSSPSKSATIQIQTPQVLSATLIPQDYLGVTVSGMEFSWEPAEVLMAEIQTVSRQLDLAQSLATYVAPATSSLFSFKGGSISIGGSAVADVHGGGNISIQWGLRDDAFALGSTGLISKPVPNELPSASGSFTADFNGLTAYNRVINDTIADVVLTFEGATIASTYKEKITITIPDCGFDGSPPTVSGPGPVTEEVSFVNASATSDPPIITYQSTDTAV